MKKLITLSLIVFLGSFVNPIREVSAINSPINIDKLSVGSFHGLILTDEKEIYAFGTRSNGNFGDGIVTNDVTNRLINITDSGDLANADFVADPIKKIEANNTMSAILTNAGELYLWGNNGTGSVGNGTTNHQYTPLLATNFGELSNLAAGDYIVDVSLSSATNVIFALSSTGRLFVWGSTSIGISGEGSTSSILAPKEMTSSGDLINIESPDKIIAISAGNTTPGVVSSAGKVFTWGWNSNGRALGTDALGSQNFRTTPIEITNSGALGTLSDLNDKVVDIDMNQYCGLVKTQEGRYIVWGLNTEGQGGQPTRGQYILPVIISIPLDEVNNEAIVDVYSGGGSYLALTSLGNIYTWGFNNNGSLGNGTNDGFGLLGNPINSVGILSNLNAGEYVTTVSKQSLTTIAITNEQRLIGWGPNGSKLFFGSNLPTTNTPVDLMEAMTNALKEPYEFVIDAIDAFPELNDLTLANKDEVESTRAAYDALTPEEKALVTNLATLEAAEVKIAELTQAALDQADADAVIALINNLSELNALSLADEASISAARDAYNALNSQAKALVSNLAKLNELEQGLIVLYGEIDDVINMIDALPGVVELTLSDENVVVAAREAFDALTEEQKAFVTNLVELEITEARIEELKAIQIVNQEAAQLVIDEIADLPSVETLTLEDEAAVLAAVASYDALTSEQKNLVTNYAKLQALVVQLDNLNQPQSSFNLGWILLLLIPLAFAGYYYRRRWLPLVFKQPLDKAFNTPGLNVQETVQSIQLDEIKLANISTRSQFQALSKVEAGSYLEITPDFASTNRVVVVNETLPKSLNESNRFIALTQEEVNIVKLSLTNGSAFIKKTPGSFIEQEGYYVEVDLNNNLVDNYIFAKTRLAPTTTKGHRWIKIETRKIKE